MDEQGHGDSLHLWVPQNLIDISDIERRHTKILTGGNYGSLKKRCGE